MFPDIIVTSTLIVYKKVFQVYYLPSFNSQESFSELMMTLSRPHFSNLHSQLSFFQLKMSLASLFPVPYYDNARQT